MQQTISFNRLLTLIFLFICLMITARIYMTDSLVHLFLIWNIFLAWIPYILSRYMLSYRRKQIWKQAFLFLTWLVFFPNALYIVTDLIHLRDRAGAPVWYDAILLFTSSLLGLLFAYASLYRVERYLHPILGKRRMPVAMAGLIVLSSFGVYLGRFDRWNSWDLLHDPLALTKNILQYLLYPADNMHTWATTAIFSGFFYLMYLLAKWIQANGSKIKT